MTDDYLADFERELHAAAQRRTARAPRRRWLAPAFGTAVAATAAVFVVLSLAGAPEREVEVPPAAPPATGTEVKLPGVAPATACVPERSEVAPPTRMSVFGRTQHAPDAFSDDETARLVGAAAYDPDATRSPSGIGERVLLSPTNRVGCEKEGESGVCVVAETGSRCFTGSDIISGRALLLVEPGKVVGLVPDGIGSVVLTAAGRRTQVSVVENAFLAEIPTDARTAVLALEPPSGCAPPDAMRRAVPVLDKEPDPGGVPPAVRGYRGRDAAVAARYARIWGGGDGVTYWVVPRLKCDGAEEDKVCVVPLIEAEAGRDGGGGGDACAALDELGRGWIHFPLSDGGAAVAGFAPPGASDVRVRIREGGFEQRFTVKDGVWGGTLQGYRPSGEVGGLLVEFDVPYAAAPAVAVLNGTTVTGLGRTIMDALVGVNYRAAENDVGDWSEHGVERTVVYEAADQPGLGERIAIHLGERFAGPRPLVRAMSDEARELGGDDADAVVVAGRDLVP